jgi:outer membrane protein
MYIPLVLSDSRTSLRLFVGRVSASTTKKKIVMCLVSGVLWVFATSARGEPEASATDAGPPATENASGAPGGQAQASTPLEPSPFTGIDETCPSGVPGGTISLNEVVTRALCNDPRTRKTWAEVAAQTAQVGIERAAYMPTANASIEGGAVHAWQNETAANFSEDVGSTSGPANNASLNFAWLLFDSGQRAAAVKGAQQTLLAATSAHDATVQAVFLDAATAYYNLVAAQNAVAVAKEVEQFNRRTLNDAATRASKDGGGDESERLQAQASAEQAALDLNSAEGDLQIAAGQLAVLLGLAPNVRLSVDSNDVAAPDQRLDHSIDELMERALAAHPEIRAAQARVTAARANADASKYANRPTLTLVQGNEWEHDVWGGKQSENRLTLQLSIPIFDSAHRYRKRAALAELAAAGGDMASTRQKVSLDVWTAYQNLRTQSGAVERNRRLLDTARRLLKSEQDLYRSGEGDMLDLLYAQQTVADASPGRLEALTKWRVARLGLAASLGQLGFWTIGKPSAGR